MATRIHPPREAVPPRASRLRPRRRALLGGAATLLLACPGRAETYPSRGISYVVPFAPGGLTDLLARLVAERLARETGQTVVIDNKPGGGGILGTEFVARAAPDGYTLLAATNAPFASLPHLNPVRYDPLRDIVPVALLADVYMPIFVHPSVPARDLAGLVAHAKAHPGTLNFGSGGAGTVGHLSGEYLKARAGIAMQHVPYRSSAQSLQACLTNEVQVLFGPEGTESALESKLTAIAIMGPARWPKLPGVQTTTEAGYPDWALRSWQSVAVPGQTPRAIQERLNALVIRILAEPELRSRIEAMGCRILPLSPEELAQRARADHAAFGEVIRAAGITTTG
ncbi:tripartite tricarboxylate transporter substrate binding protein [Roseomonas sp. OT10]|uniref:Bug family tripartite tricarboxylate transporter substrate binding protein n=1 Tax=Roseomonas cutis TaxID=2897332 RepID=UPI001E406451|nr:tripartite tricarboxylate transporter substrate binding protein [Roseomonas sp. OT10]UFN51303.1 tripartite tricarboxylate transporter substrate binding protein [Roseomonas sp. OT10]